MNDALPVTVLRAPSQLPIVRPDFNPREPGVNPYVLLELYQVPWAMPWKPDKIPVGSAAVALGNKNLDSFPIDESSWQVALLLGYLMALENTPRFLMTQRLRWTVWSYIGDQAASTIEQFPGRNRLIANLLQTAPEGTDFVTLSLTLRPGYENFHTTGRSVREVIEHAWNDELGRLNLSEGSVRPMLRKALQQLFAAHRTTGLMVYPHGSGSWPTQLWLERGRELAGKLAMTV